MADLIREGIDLGELVRNGGLTLEGSEEISFSQRYKDTMSMAEEKALRLADKIKAHYAAVKKVSGNSERDEFKVDFYSSLNSI